MHRVHAAFIPAAGLGERLRPITDHLPKPLLPLLGKPVLQKVLERVDLLQPDRIGINLHYRGDDIRQWAEDSVFAPRITFFPESPILGTGGALKNAASFLEDGTFLVHNADIYSDVDLAALLERHRTDGNLVTLAMHDHAQFNNVIIDGNGSFLGLHRAGTDSLPGTRLMAFTGIALYEPAFLAFLPDGISHVTDAWQRARAAGHRIGTHDVTGGAWSDIGTPEAYAKTVFSLLRADGETVFFHESSSGCDRSRYEGYVSVESGADLSGASLRNCIVLAGCDAGSRELSDAIVYPGGVVQVNLTNLFGGPDAGMIEIGAGGSDRRYFRVEHAGNRTVLMQCLKRDEEFERQAAYTRFFSAHGIRVPRLLSVAKDRPAMLFEDLGDLSLYSWLRCRRSHEAVEIMYRKVLDQLVRLHGGATEQLEDCPLLAERIFDYDYLRWETAYFVDRFVIGLLNRSDHDRNALDAEFHRLAAAVDAAPRTIIHRDCQSQNVMLKNGTEVCLIDYQGARLLSPAYDIASLLWDPYYRLDDKIRERLIAYYLDAMKKSAAAFDADAFMRVLLPCRLQRHMQALGAYGFLAKVKGKPSFLKYVPEGLRLLKEDVRAAEGAYPLLGRLIADLHFNSGR